MSGFGDYAPSTHDLSYAPWNKEDPKFEYGQCPNCESFDTFEARTIIKGKKCTRFICRQCFKKFE
jgi:hypothetical protein